ncbi:MAG: VWA domain-containing protein [Planctomycetota bacterium]
MMNLTTPLPLVALGLMWQQAQPASPSVPRAAASSAVTEILPDAFPAPLQIPQDVDLALCLDTSGSMGGLLDSARQRLWSLVNELALAEPTPRLRVALLTYGTPGYGADSGFVQTALPLTEDLDMVSLKLFELTTNGGDEYVARVTQTATESLAWSAEPNALKMIVVAGNESAEQDPLFTLEAACGSAISKGIVVHSLYCDETGQGGQTLQGRATRNSQAQSIAAPVPQTTATPSTNLAPQPLSVIALGWKKVAQLSDGAFAMIQTQNGAPVIETPFDTVLMELSTSLNETYIPYGSGSAWALGNQQVQDSNASGLNNDAAANRAVSKAGKLYFCSWDLLDSLGNGTMTHGEIDPEQLPEPLRELSPEALRAHIEEKREARAKLQAEITETGEKRSEWLVRKRLELGTDETKAFDTPLRKAFRELAQARGFRFAQPKQEQPATASEPEAE